jgi:hypothetical protein
MKKLTFALSALSLLFLVSCGPQPTEFSMNDLRNDYINLKNSLVSEIENFRGKSFKRNITIYVCSSKEYSKLITENTTSADAKDKQNKILICEGLLQKGQDYFESHSTTLSNETAGFYKDGSDSIFVVVKDATRRMSLEDQSVIFHEMIHALQDQYYPLKSLLASDYSDQYFAKNYAIEGEAELMSMNYFFKIYSGSYQDQTTVMNYFSDAELEVNGMLDSMHLAGNPLYVSQPMYWMYYSYGPKFINAIVDKNWSLIDTKIFSSMPFKTSEILHPSKFTNKQELLLDFNRLNDSIDSTFVIYDSDEFGEVLLCTMLREWDNNSYKVIADGLDADNATVFRDTQDDSLRFIWYTLWENEAKSTEFFNNYLPLVQKKWGVTLPNAQIDSSGRTFVNDQKNRIYIEQDSTHVFTIENYSPDHLQGWIDQLRIVKSYVRGLAKEKQGKKYPVFIKKRLIRDKTWTRLL